MAGETDVKDAVAVTGVVGRNVELDNGAGMIGDVIKCGPQTAEADVSGGRDNIGERDCGRAIEILERCAVAGAEAEIAHAKLIARKVRRPGLLRGEHARIGRGKIPAQMHDRFKVVISVGDTRWVNGEP